jgi:hypothetical protein
MSWNHDGTTQADARGVEYLDGLYSYALVLPIETDAQQERPFVLLWYFDIEKRGLA